MNDKIKAILLKVVIELKKYGWKSHEDVEITFRSEGFITLLRNIPVQGSLGDQEWDDNLSAELALTLGSQDQITWYPDYTITGEIYIPGGDIKDVNYKMDADVGFVEADSRDIAKIQLAARKINNYAQNHIQEEYYDYIDANASAIQHYKAGGYKADNDEDR